MKLMASSYIELWYFEVIKVDVCGSLVLSNSVTYYAGIMLNGAFMLKIMLT